MPRTKVLGGKSGAVFIHHPNHTGGDTYAVRHLYRLGKYRTVLVCVDGGYNWLYFTSGQADAKSKPMIIRSPWNILGSTPVERVMTFKDLSGAVEIEAPQLTGNDILFGIEQGPSGNKTHYIYSVKKSIF